VHAPQAPEPQTSLVPVRPISSRRTSISMVSSASERRRDWPLTVKPFIAPPHVGQSDLEGANWEDRNGHVTVVDHGARTRQADRAP
jgi:hypothetical protein